MNGNFHFRAIKTKNVHLIRSAAPKDVWDWEWMEPKRENVRRHAKQQVNPVPTALIAVIYDAEGS